MGMWLNVRLISWQKKILEQIAQPRGPGSKKHQTSKCFVSQFLLDLREVTSPPTGSPKLVSKSRSHNMSKSPLNPTLLPSGSHERHAVAAKTSCYRFGRTDLSRFMPMPRWKSRRNVCVKRMGRGVWRKGGISDEPFSSELLLSFARGFQQIRALKGTVPLSPRLIFNTQMNSPSFIPNQWDRVYMEGYQAQLSSCHYSETTGIPRS
jgi:hypothetical protein